jgi:drug/metabolite transporter (DMT)-like permease
MGGFCFALNNAMLRRLRDVPSEQRMFAMFFGGLLFSLVVGLLGSWHGSVALPSMLPAGGWALLLGFAVFFLISNVTLQYGAARLICAARRSSIRDAHRAWRLTHHCRSALGRMG